MDWNTLKQKITSSPRNKLLTVIIIVVLITIITEIFPLISQLNQLRFLNNYLYLIILIFVILLVFFIIKRNKNKSPKKAKQQKQILQSLIPLDKASDIFQNLKQITSKKINLKKQFSKNVSQLPTKQEIEEVFGRKPVKEQKIIQSEIEKQRQPVASLLEQTRDIRKTKKESEWVKTGIEGFDALFANGIPRGTATLLAGGPGSGKTIFCLQALNYVATSGEKVLYISLEESEKRLKKHMLDFNFNPDKLEKQGFLKIIRIDPFKISRNVEALLAEAKGELKSEITEIGNLFPQGFIPDWVIVDSLTALEASFKGGEDSYRIYIEQLFRYFERSEVTSFLITETGQIPTRYSKSGVEEFLADCVVVLYNIKRGNVRERAIEVLKLRGGKHEEKIVAMNIESGKGIVVYPEQELFEDVDNEK